MMLSYSAEFHTFFGVLELSHTVVKPGMQISFLYHNPLMIISR